MRRVTNGTHEDADHVPSLVEVLVVDDSMTDAAAVRLLLQDTARCTDARSLAEAVALLDGPVTFDAVLCDLTMSDATMLEAPRRLLAHPRCPTLVVISSNEDVGVADDAMQIGVADYLIKSHLTAPDLLVRTLTLAMRRGEVARQRRAQMDRLRDTNRRLAEAAQATAHDLRNPLAALKGFAERLEEGPLDVTTQQRVGQAMAASTARLLTMVEEMLAQVDGHERSPVALGEVVAWAVDALRPDLVRTDGAVEVAALPTVTSDPVALRQVVLNLLSNAIRYRRPDRAPRVAVSAATTGEAVLVTVADNGIGVPVGRRERIFSRGVGSDHPDSTGLGLAAVAANMARMEGWVEAHDSPLGGLAVTFSLPLRPEPT